MYHQHDLRASVPNNDQRDPAAADLAAPDQCLIDGVRHFRPDDLPPASGEELRPILRPRITVRPASG